MVLKTARWIWLILLLSSSCLVILLIASICNVKDSTSIPSSTPVPNDTQILSVQLKPPAAAANGSPEDSRLISQDTSSVVPSTEPTSESLNTEDQTEVTYFTISDAAEDLEHLLMTRSTFTSKSEVGKLSLGNYSLSFNETENRMEDKLSTSITSTLVEFNSMETQGTGNPLKVDPREPPPKQSSSTGVIGETPPAVTSENAEICSKHPSRLACRYYGRSWTVFNGIQKNRVKVKPQTYLYQQSLPDLGNYT